MPNVTIQETEDTSQVRDMRHLWKKIDRRTRRMDEAQQRTYDQVVGVKTELAATTARVEDQGKRVRSLERAIISGHACLREEDFKEIRQDIRDNLGQLQGMALESVQTRSVADMADEKAREVTERVDDLEDGNEERGNEERKSLRSRVTTIILSTLGALTILSSGVYYIAQLDARDQQQYTHTVEANKRLEKQVGAIQSKLETIDPTEEIEALTKEIQRDRERAAKQSAGGAEDGSWFFSMDRQSRQRFCHRQPAKTIGLLPSAIRAACRAIRE